LCRLRLFAPSLLDSSSGSLALTEGSFAAKVTEEAMGVQLELAAVGYNHGNRRPDFLIYGHLRDLADHVIEARRACLVDTYA